MTPKEALSMIWHDAYPKACETWDTDRLCEHWRVVEKALNELESLKKDVARYFELISKCPIWTLYENNEFHKLDEKLSKVGKE